MVTYSVQGEASRILSERLLGDPKLNFPKSFTEAAKKVSFTGDDSQPFVPTPLKITESSCALNALVAIAASVVSKDRYGIDYQDIEVNSDIATLFLMSVILPTVNGIPVRSHETIQSELKKADLYLVEKPIHIQSTTIYKTKDGRWYHLHGSLNAAHTMKMVGVPEQDVTHEEARKIYAEKVAQWDSETIEKVSNDQYRQAGVVCYTPEEFFSSEQGRIMAEEPLYTLKVQKAPRKLWPPTRDVNRPLSGIRVIDFSRVIAAPVISKILAVLGADVIKVTSSELPDLSSTWVDLSTGKRDTNINLKTEEGCETFKKLVESADVLIDGYRPGALERLGFNSAGLREINPSLIYLRENCYGFKGPLSHRSGWQQISDCLVGLSWLQGKFMGLNEPVVPLLPNSDYQMGIAGAAAVMQALLARAQDDVTFDIDISLTQYNIWYYRLGQYTQQQQEVLRSRNKDFSVRHDDDMPTLIAKTLEALKRCRPDAFIHPEYFQKMSGREWGIEDDIDILASPFKLSKTIVGYSTPSGRRGRSQPEWTEVYGNRRVI